MVSKITRPKGSKNKATKRWEAYWLSKQKAKAWYQAKHEYLKKNPLESLKGWIKNIDPLELASVLATTYVIHGVITTTTEIYERVININQGIQIVAGTPDWVDWLPFGNTPLGLLSNLPWLINTLIQGGFSEEQAKNTVEGLKKIVEKPNTDSLFIWAVSFAIAYYVQKHGITDIIGSIKGFLGLAAA